MFSGVFKIGRRKSSSLSGTGYRPKQPFPARHPGPNNEYSRTLSVNVDKSVNADGQTGEFRSAANRDFETLGGITTSRVDGVGLAKLVLFGCPKEFAMSKDHTPISPLEEPVRNVVDIDQLQLEAYRRMTGEERLKIGLGLFEASLAIAREGIRNRYPDASEAEIEEKLKERIRVGYEIESATSNTS